MDLLTTMSDALDRANQHVSRLDGLERRLLAFSARAQAVQKTIEEQTASVLPLVAAAIQAWQSLVTRELGTGLQATLSRADAWRDETGKGLQRISESDRAYLAELQAWVETCRSDGSRVQGAIERNKPRLESQLKALVEHIKRDGESLSQAAQALREFSAVVAAYGQRLDDSKKLLDTVPVALSDELAASTTKLADGMKDGAQTFETNLKRVSGDARAALAGIGSGLAGNVTGILKAPVEKVEALAADVRDIVEAVRKTGDALEHAFSLLNADAGTSMSVFDTVLEIAKMVHKIRVHLDHIAA